MTTKEKFRLIEEEFENQLREEITSYYGSIQEEDLVDSRVKRSQKELKEGLQKKITDEFSAFPEFNEWL